mgnify:CR=1 FL=1
MRAIKSGVKKRGWHSRKAVFIRAFAAGTLIMLGSCAPVSTEVKRDAGAQAQKTEDGQAARDTDSQAQRGVEEDRNIGLARRIMWSLINSLRNAEGDDKIEVCAEMALSLSYLKGLCKSDGGGNCRLHEDYLSEHKKECH